MSRLISMLAQLMVALSLGTSGSLLAWTVGTTADDLQHRSDRIKWPAGFNPLEAQSFAHNELLIHTGCPKVWSHLVDVPRWPNWLNIIKNAKYLDGATKLGRDTRFEWKILSYQEESKIEEFVINSRLGWYSYTPGQKPLYYHAWLLTPTPQGCRVTTEEVGLGPDAAKTAKSGDTETHRAHDLWLASLGRISDS